MNRALQIGVGVLAQSSLLLLLGLLAGGLLRRRGPELRAFIYQVTLAGMALGALLSVGVAGRVRPVWGVHLPMKAAIEAPGPAPSLTIPVVVPSVPQPGRVGVTHHLASQGPPKVGGLGAETEGQTGDRSAWVYGMLAGLWAVGTGLLLLWLLTCQWHLVRLRRGGTLIAEGAAHEALARLCAPLGVHPPLLLASPRVRSPFLTGILRPAILLPASWETDFDDATLSVVLAHETAHLARRDCAWTLLLRLTCAVLWPQPLLWLLARQMEQASEEACDLMALTPDCPPRRYADCLLSLATRVLPSHAERTLGAGIIPVRSSLGRRIQNILDRRNHPMTALSTRLRVTVTLGLVTASLAGAFLVSASAPAQKPLPAASPLVGVWGGHPSGDKKNTEKVTFQPDGRFIEFNPRSGGHAYGTYAVTGDMLKVITTRQEHGSGPVTMNHPPYTAILHFKIVDDMLTFINTRNGSKESLTRISDIETDAAASAPAQKPPSEYTSGNKNNADTMTFDRSARSPIIGVWLYQQQPIGSNTNGVVIYQPNGKFEYIFAGNARHDQRQTYGTYVLNGNRIKEYTTRASFEDPNVFNHSHIWPIDVTLVTLTFNVSNDTLTIRDGTGEKSVAKRIAKTADPALIEKWVGKNSVPQVAN